MSQPAPREGRQCIDARILVRQDLDSVGHRSLHSGPDDTLDSSCARTVEDPRELLRRRLDASDMCLSWG